MRPIVTVTLNPALDLATAVDAMVPGRKLRCAAPRVDPGGGGVNVARTLHHLGDHPLAVVAVGGTTGRDLVARIEMEGVQVLPVEVSGETRQSFAVFDRASGEQYRFSLPGAPMSVEDAHRVTDAVHDAAPDGALVVLSGSLPPGLTEAYPVELNAALADRGADLVVDTSGAALARLVEAPERPFHILRLDQAESEDAAGHTLPDLPSAIDFARGLIARGVAEMVISGRRKHGSLLVTADTALFCVAPEVRVGSRIGAGDAFVGGFCHRWAAGADAAEALRWGVAAASATVMTEGTLPCTREEALKLLPQCVVSEV